MFQMSSAALGDDFVVKFAWSQAAARFILHQITILETLALEPTVPYLPEVAAAGTSPLILATRRVRGDKIVRSRGPDRPGRFSHLSTGYPIHHFRGRERGNSRAGSQHPGACTCLRCKRSEVIFHGRNMPLTCGNVELRGFEPLTSWMPCLAVWFNGIVLSRIAAGPADIGV